MSWFEEALGGDLAVGLWTIGLGLLAAIPCAVLGVYLVLRRMSLLGDAISHAVLPGIAVGFLLTGRVSGPGIVLGAMAVGVLTAGLSQGLSSLARVPEDSGLGVVFTSLFALGVLILTNAAADVDLDPGCVLYGLIELSALDTVSIGGFEVPRSLGSLGLSAALTFGFVSLLWKELKLTSFDPGLASAVGLNAGLIHYGLMAVVAGVTVTAFEAVGSILVVAMMIVPAASAHLISDRLGPMMGWAVLISGIATVGGYLGAVALNTSIAGMMAVCGGSLFTAAVLLAPRHGLLSKLAHQLQLRMRIDREDILARLYRKAEQGEPAIAPGLARLSILDRLAGWQLRQRGLIGYSDDGGKVLTEQGRKNAREVVAAHRLWETYLERNLALPVDHLHDPAERLEHYIGPELLRTLAEELDQPAADPHGRTIPAAHEEGK